MRKLFILAAALIMVLGISFTAAAYPNYNMSWSFNTFNNPDARQAAINRAETQDGLVESTQDSIDQFKEGLDRRLYSQAQSEIIDKIMEDEDFDKEKLRAGDLEINLGKDEDTGEVIVKIYDTETGESTVITYSDNWGNWE